MKKNPRPGISPVWKNKWRLIWFGSILFFLFLFPAPNIYFAKAEKTSGIKIAQKIDLPPPPPYPINKEGELLPQLTAEGILIKDIQSGVILYEKNAAKRFPQASTTKIITALVTLDTFSLDDVMTVKTVISEGRVMGLVAGEKITAEALLYGALVHSANDATYTLAENYPGGVTKFVEAMNEKAKSLFLADTHFTNPIGFDDPNHYSTAVDLGKQAIAALRNKTFAKIVGTRAITVSDVTFTYFHPLTNVNELLGKISGVSGVKTGFTQTAGEILVSEVKKNGKSVLFIVLKSHDRFGETIKLIDWVFKNFVWVPFEEIIPTIRQIQQEQKPQNAYPPQIQK